MAAVYRNKVALWLNLRNGVPLGLWLLAYNVFHGSSCFGFSKHQMTLCRGALLAPSFDTPVHTSWYGQLMPLM